MDVILCFSNFDNGPIIICNVAPGKAQEQSEHQSETMGMHASSVIICWLREYYHIVYGLITFFYDGEISLNSEFPKEDKHR